MIDAPTRVLVLANETLADTTVVEEIRARVAGRDAEVLVVAPEIPHSRLAHLLGTRDPAALESAETRLAASVTALREAGMEASGRTGDEDPLQALDDAVRTFRPDEIVISTHVPERSAWIERGVVGRARRRYPVPITHLVVDLGSGLRSIEGPSGQGASGEPRVTVYHAAPYDRAIAIRERGFGDARTEPGGGVLMTTSAEVAARGEGVVLALDLPVSVVDTHRGHDPGAPDRVVLPAELLDSAGPARTVGDWSE